MTSEPSNRLKLAPSPCLLSSAKPGPTVEMATGPSACGCSSSHHAVNQLAHQLLRIPVHQVMDVGAVEPASTRSVDPDGREPHPSLHRATPARTDAGIATKPMRAIRLCQEDTGPGPNRPKRGAGRVALSGQDRVPGLPGQPGLRSDLAISGRDGPRDMCGGVMKHPRTASSVWQGNGVCDVDHAV